MSHEGSPSQQNYELPADQLQFEFELIDSYAEKFPEHRWLMDEALTTLKRFAEFNIPKYKVDKEDFVAMWTDGQADENGYLDPGNVEMWFSRLSITNPPSDEEVALSELTQQGRTRLDAQKYCDVVFGAKIPEHTTALLDGLYRLTGAKIAFAIEPVPGGTPGHVFRVGTYGDKVIYFDETRRNQSPQWYGEDLFNASVLDEEGGKRAVALFSGTNQVQ